MKYGTLIGMDVDERRAVAAKLAAVQVVLLFHWNVVIAVMMILFLLIWIGKYVWRLASKEEGDSLWEL